MESYVIPIALIRYSETLHNNLFQIGLRPPINCIGWGVWCGAARYLAAKGTNSWWKVFLMYHAFALSPPHKKGFRGLMWNTPVLSGGVIRNPVTKPLDALQREFVSCIAFVWLVGTIVMESFSRIALQKWGSVSEKFLKNRGEMASGELWNVPHQTR